MVAAAAVAAVAPRGRASPVQHGARATRPWALVQAGAGVDALGGGAEPRRKAGVRGGPVRAKKKAVSRQGPYVT